MGAPIRFQPGDCWEFNGTRLRFDRQLGDRMLLFIVERTLAPFQIEDAEHGLCAPDFEWACRAFAEGKLRQVADRRGLPSARQQAEQREYDPETAAKMDAQYRMRRFVLQGFDAMGHVDLGEKAIRDALARLWRKHPAKALALGRMPSARSVKRWMETRGSPGERLTRQLISMSGRVERAARLPLVTQRLLQKAALDYWSDRGRSIEDAYARMSRLLFYINERRQRSNSGLEQLSRPSSETLRRQVRRLECFDTYAAKFGAGKAKTRFKGDGKGLTAQRFLRLGCMDHTLLDTVAVIDADTLLPMGRPWLTVLMDVRTRCIVGFVLTYASPSNYAATECIKRANRPKLHLLDRQPNFPVLANIFGRFDEIVVDNGWELSGITFQDTMADVGTTVRWAPIKSPTYKAIVERFFGVLNQLLNHKLPGAALKPELLRELDYDPHKAAVLTIEELESLIWTAISYYHIEHHSELNCPPASLWQRDMEAYGIGVIGDDRQLDKMAGALQPSCRLSRSGVELFGLRFHEPVLTSGLLEDLIGLQPVRGQRKGSATATVKVKYNPENIAEIHVWNARWNVYVSLPCTEERYAAGISLWHHKQLQQWTKAKGLEFSSEKDRLSARAALIAEVEAMAPDLKIRQRRAIARLLGSARVTEQFRSSVGIALAPARHDGMAPTIEHEALASNRGDGGQAPKRPARGGAKPKSRSPKSSSPKARPSDPAPESDDDIPNTLDWKGFDQ